MLAGKPSAIESENHSLTCATTALTNGSHGNEGFENQCSNGSVDNNSGLGEGCGDGGCDIFANCFLNRPAAWKANKDEESSIDFDDSSSGTIGDGAY